MKQLWIATLSMVGVLAAQPSSAAMQNAEAGSSRVAPDGPKNTHEWKRLRAEARTSDDFLALAKWCESRAGAYRAKQAASEAELREYYAAGRFFNQSKNAPRRDEVLKREIETDEKLVKHWTELGGIYVSKAQELEAAEQPAMTGGDASPGRHDSVTVKK